MTDNNKMKLSRPYYQHIRIDKNLPLAKDYHLIRCQMGYHPSTSTSGTNPVEYILGARFTVVFYIERPENEVAGYLGEVDSVILNHSTPEEDKKTILFFAKDTFQNFVEYLRKELPALDVNFIPSPNYSVILEDWIKMLHQQGMYK
jgi:hypothetical protein